MRENKNEVKWKLFAEILFRSFSDFFSLVRNLFKFQLVRFWVRRMAAQLNRRPDWVERSWVRISVPARFFFLTRNPRSTLLNSFLCHTILSVVFELSVCNLDTRCLSERWTWFSKTNRASGYQRSSRLELKRKVLPFIAASVAPARNLIF